MYLTKVLLLITSLLLQLHTSASLHTARTLEKQWSISQRNDQNVIVSVNVIDDSTHFAYVSCEAESEKCNVTLKIFRLNAAAAADSTKSCELNLRVGDGEASYKPSLTVVTFENNVAVVAYKVAAKSSIGMMKMSPDVPYTLHAQILKLDACTYESSRSISFRSKLDYYRVIPRANAFDVIISSDAAECGDKFCVHTYDLLGGQSGATKTFLPNHQLKKPKIFSIASDKGYFAISRDADSHKLYSVKPSGQLYKSVTLKSVDARKRYAYYNLYSENAKLLLCWQVTHASPIGCAQYDENLELLTASANLTKKATELTLKQYNTEAGGFLTWFVDYSTSKEDNVRIVQVDSTRSAAPEEIAKYKGFVIGGKSVFGKIGLKPYETKDDYCFGIHKYYHMGASEDIEFRYKQMCVEKRA